MADSRMDEIRARLKAATPGPWHACTCGICELVMTDPDAIHIATTAHLKNDDGILPSDEMRKANRDLIANAPRDLEYLLWAVEDFERAQENLKAEVAYLRARLADIGVIIRSVEGQGS